VPTAAFTGSFPTRFRGNDNKRAALHGEQKRSLVSYGMTLWARKWPSFIEPIRIFPKNTELYFRAVWTPKDGVWVRRIKGNRSRDYERSLRMSLIGIRSSDNSLLLLMPCILKLDKRRCRSFLETRVCQRKTGRNTRDGEIATDNPIARLS